MNFLSLWVKIGKQPIKVTRKANVIALFDYEFLEQLLKEKKTCYTIPLQLKFGNSEQRMWLIAQNAHTNKGEVR